MIFLQHARNIHEIREEVDINERREILILSDVHYDSTNCDRELLKSHLDEALENGSAIFLNGDFLDLMGGKYDPRNTLPGGLRPEYRGQNYFDLVIEDAIEFLRPYKDQLFVYAQGNHETNVRKRQHTDPSERMVKGLQSIGSRVQLGGYSGWVRWKLAYRTEEMSFLIHYHHGYGGNAPRSKGVLHADIDTAKFPDADFIIRGHDHNKWHVPVVVERLTKRNRRHEKKIHHVRCGSYKMLGDGFSGWEVEKGFGRPSLGGYFIQAKRKSGSGNKGQANWTTGVREAYI